MQKNDKKLYIVKKYVWASSAKEAIRKDRVEQVDDVWVDEEWKKNQPTLKDGVGFYRDVKK